jgi:hypothetical protein
MREVILLSTNELYADKYRQSQFLLRGFYAEIRRVARLEILAARTEDLLSFVTLLVLTIPEVGGMSFGGFGARLLIGKGVSSADFPVSISLERVTKASNTFYSVRR